MSEQTTSHDRARAALTAYAAADHTRPGHELLTDMFTDVLHVAAQAGINAGAVLNSTRRNMLEEAQEAEEVDIAHVTVRLRVVSYAWERMDRTHLVAVLRAAIKDLVVGVAQDESQVTSPDRLYPWIQVEHVEIHPDTEADQV